MRLIKWLVSALVLVLLLIVLIAVVKYEVDRAVTEALSSIKTLPKH